MSGPVAKRQIRLVAEIHVNGESTTARVGVAHAGSVDWLPSRVRTVRFGVSRDSLEGLSLSTVLGIVERALHVAQTHGTLQLSEDAAMRPGAPDGATGRAGEVQQIEGQLRLDLPE